MEIKLRKLDNEMHGPEVFAVCTEQELIELGYVWEFYVFRGGWCIRTGYSKIKTEQEVRAYIASDMNRLEWEAMHGE